jgi:hypothetical protein
MYVRGYSAGPDASEGVLWHVRGQAPEVPQKLGRFTDAHLLESNELAEAFLSGVDQPHKDLGLQRGVRVSFGRRGDDILYFCGVPVVQLLDYVE